MKRTELQRSSKPLARGKSLARTGPLKTKRRNLPAAERRAAREFHLASRGEPCVVCRDGIAWWSHHVVYRQHCPPGRKWDRADALAVCDDCHHQHHHSVSFRIPREALSDNNLNFASDVLGESAGTYLARYYD